MNIVIDTNVFISALIKEGITRELLTNLNNRFLFPEFEFAEIKKHKIEIQEKSELSDREFNILFLRLLNYVKIIPEDIIEDFRNEACNLMNSIDPDDTPFIATALSFNCPIWSDDKHFKKQDKVKIFTTKDMVELTKL